MPEVPGVRHRFVEADGLRVHVAEAGRSGAPPVVLVHGWPQHWYAWRRMIPDLAATHRVVCPDLRGLGWTDAPPRGYEKEQLATDLLALLDALKIDRVPLVGHDWGGFAGFLAALRAPERISRLVALGISPPWARGRPDPSIVLRASYQALLASPVAGTAVLRWMPSFVRALIRRGSVVPAWSEAELDLYAERLVEPARARASQAIYRTFLVREVPAILRGHYDDARLTVPTLLLNGDRDPVIRPDLLRDVGRQATSLTAEQVPSCGHFLPEEQPLVVGSRVAAFLDGAA